MASTTCLALDGVADFCTATSHTEIAILGALTVEHWVKDLAGGGWNHAWKQLWTKGNEDAGDAGYHAIVEFDTLYWRWKDSGFVNHGITYSLASGPTATNWNHFAFTRATDANKTLRIFINGVQVATGTSAGTVADAGTTFYLGQRGNSSNYWNGSFYDFRIWSTERTATQIADNYLLTNLDALQETLLVANWLFTEGTGTTAADTAGVAQNLTLSGATWVTDAPSVTDKTYGGGGATVRPRSLLTLGVGAG